MAGGHILAAAIRGVAPIAAYKGSDQSQASNNTAFAADTDLSIGLAANSRYLFIAMLGFTGAATGSGDLATSFAWPAGSAGQFSGWGIFANATAVPSGAGNTNTSAFRTSPGSVGAGKGSVYLSFGSAGGTQVPAFMMGSVAVGATAGNLQLLWMQNTSSSTATIVKAGSWLAAWQTQ